MDIDFKTNHHTLFPLLTYGYGYLFTSKNEGLSLDFQHGESCMLTGQGGRKENTFYFVFLQACADATMGFISESSR